MALSCCPLVLLFAFATADTDEQNAAGTTARSSQPSSGPQQIAGGSGQPTLRCANANAEWHFYAGDVNRGGMPNRPLVANSRIVLHLDGARYVFQTNVLASTDGAGNTAFQVLHVGDGRGFEAVVDLLYDHELGGLRGFYSLPQYATKQTRTGVKDMLVGFGAARLVSPSSMPCTPLAGAADTPQPVP